MKNNKYTMDDIANYIDAYNNNEDYWLPNPLIRIMFSEKKLSEMAYCQRIRMAQLKEEYNIIRRSTIEEQEKYIMTMTPILDKFYQRRGKSKKR